MGRLLEMRLGKDWCEQSWLAMQKRRTLKDLTRGLYLADTHQCHILCPILLALPSCNENMHKTFFCTLLSLFFLIIHFGCYMQRYMEWLLLQTVQLYQRITASAHSQQRRNVGKLGTNKAISTNKGHGCFHSTLTTACFQLVTSPM